MYAKISLIVFSILFVVQAEASAQRLRIFRASNAGCSNCCQNQPQCNGQAQYQPQSQGWQRVDQFAPANYQTPFVGESSVPVESYVNNTYQIQSGFRFETQPQSLPYEIVSEALPVESLSPSQYGTVQTPYSTVVGSLPLASESFLPQEPATNATVVPSTVMGTPSPAMSTQSTSIEYSSPAIATPGFATPTPGIATPANAENFLDQPPAPALAGSSQAIESTPETVIETRTIAPVKPNEPAPDAMPEGMEAAESEAGSILSTDSGT